MAWRAQARRGVALRGAIGVLKARAARTARRCGAHRSGVRARHAGLAPARASPSIAPRSLPQPPPESADPTSAEARPELRLRANLGPKLGRFREEMSAESGRSRAKFGRFGQALADVWPKLGQEVAEFGSTSAPSLVTKFARYSGPTSAEFGRGRAKSGRNPANRGRLRANVGPCRTNFGGPSSGQMWSTSGHMWSTSGQSCAESVQPLVKMNQCLGEHQQKSVQI